MLATPLCRRLQVRVPVVQAPIGSAASPPLAAAVSNAGGLGMLAVTWLSERDVRDQIRQVRQGTDRPFGVNLVLDFPVAGQLDACLAEGVGIISTFWGDPATAHGRIRASGAIHLHSVGSVDEACRAADAGVDVLVAQGCEAGGHVRGTVAALARACGGRRGGAATGDRGGWHRRRPGLAAALALGAQAAWLGTRFLAATEAYTHEVYRQLVIDAAAEDSVHTGCFDGGWPDVPHRAIRHSRRLGGRRVPSRPAPAGGRRGGGGRRRRPLAPALRRPDPATRHARKPG